MSVMQTVPLLTAPDRIPETMRVGKHDVPVRRTDVERFIALTEPAGNECLAWGGYIDKHTGYGHYGLAAQVTVLAHRFAFTIWRRPIAAGLEIDHECHNRDWDCAPGPSCRHRRCEQPWHLEATTRSANLLAANMTRPAETHRNGRKDRCPARHLYDEENTYWWSGMRTCKACRRLYQRALRAVKRGDYPSMAVALIEYGYYPPPDEDER